MRLLFAKIAMFVLAIFSWQSQSIAQGWERTYGFSNADGLSDVLPTADGGYLTVGNTQASNGLDRQVYLVKTDADGQSSWSTSFGDGLRQEFPKSIVPDGEGGYVIGGTSIYDGIPFGFLARIDHLGNQVWLTVTVQDSVQGRQVIRLADGNFALAGSFQKPAQAGAPNYDFFLLKADENGNILWTKTFGGNLFEEAYALAELPSNDLLLAGFTNGFGAGGYDVFLVKTNANGDSILAKTLGTTAAEHCFGMAATSDGNFAITGQRNANGASGQDVFLAKIDPNGNEIWWRNYPMPGIETSRSVSQATNGHFVLTGDTRVNASAERQVLMVKTWPDGTIQWQSEFGGVLGDGGNAIRPAPNNGFVLAGFTSSFGAGNSDGYLIRTDATGISLSNCIAGNVHSNLSNTCVPDNFGVFVPNYLIEIAGNKTYYGTTDSIGNYFVPVEAGDYNIRLLNPSPIWQACEDSVDVSVSGVFDTATVDFSIYAQVQCPAMQVDMTTLNLRRCFQNTYDVKYRNLGSDAASTAAVQVDFDPWLRVDSTSIPWIANYGNMYVFDVGVVPPFGEGSFRVWVTVDCDSTVLGQTHCSEAHIFPDSLCFNPDPNWDGSSIQLSATCIGDSVFFKLQNMGAGDMTAPLNYIVIEDVLMGFQGQFQLEAFEEETYSFASAGQTFRLEAEQSPGHPGNSQPSISVEGCGGNPFSTGFVVDYPLNDADLFMDTDCRENIGSFDPNDKQGFPVGYGDQHFIEPNTDIEYLIRFQNTGTDTAFNVVIRDTLSHLLDPTSIEPGASSHPYRFQVYSTGVVKFSFDHIMLPDSNTNEPLSHGYVKFRAKQRQNCQPGCVIKNSAAIYFDFNAPVITNTTFHTIGVNFIEIDPANSTDNGNAILSSVRVFPNPFEETALFELENIHANQLNFSLFDQNGRAVRQMAVNGDRFQFQRENLPSGIYYFRIIADGQTVSSGKIMLR